MPTRAPVHGRAKLTRTDQADFLTIETARGITEYLISYLEPDKEIGCPAWRLTKLENGRPTGENFDIILRPHGAECSCPDWLYRRQYYDRAGCKHLKGMRAVGLLKN